jgi:predicted peptidase
MPRLVVLLILPLALLTGHPFRAPQPQPSPPSQQDPAAAGFLARSYHSPSGETMQYRLFVPPGYHPAKKYPLVLWLHGAAGRGSDNLAQISGGNHAGTHVWTTPERQAKYHPFVLAPQVDQTKSWARPHANAPPVSIRLALEILDILENRYSIDRAREYVAGQSMGGEGAWAALALAPGRFAAALPLCGYGFDDMIAPAASTPVWIWQGAADPIVSVERARQWVAALKHAGGTPKYTEVPGWGHSVWEKAFADPQVVDWLLSQRASGTGN